MKSISFKLDENKVVNTSAWLVSVIEFANKVKFFNSFESFNLKMKEVTYTHLNKLQTLVSSIVMGCSYTTDINDKLVPDTLAAKILGMDRFPDQSQINRFLNRFDETNINQLEYIHHDIFMKNSLSLGCKEDIVVDFDMTGLIAGGKTYELAEKGYFPRKHGRKGYQVSAAFVQNTSEAISLHLDPGSTVSTNRFDDLLKDTILKLQNPVKENRVIIRADANYGSFENVKALQNNGVRFIVKGFSTKQSKNLAKDIPKDAWEKINIQVHIAELPTSSNLRIIVCEFVCKDGKIKYSHLITDIPSDEMNAVELFHFYNGRQTIEAFFKTCKDVYGIKNLRTSKFYGIYGFLWLVFLTHNLIVLMKNTTFSSTKLGDVGIKTLVKKLGNLTARIQESSNNIEIILPNLSTLAKLFVEAIRPKYVQLSFHDFLNTS